ncbi:MAG: NAD(P)-dependent alcohol dehydrogenase [Acidimicrobiales bacterium]
MKAIVQRGYGDPKDVLELEQIPVPEIGSDDVLVEVRAAGLHADVWHVVTGWPFIVRLFGLGLRGPRNPVPGIDMAGVIREVGSEVSRFSVGDEVYGEVVTGNQWRNGGVFAEFVGVAESLLEPKPASLSFVEAAAIPTSGLIAWENIRDRVSPGDAVLVNGAAGGVGMFAVQMAVAAGGEVTAVDAPHKLDALRDLGAHHVVDYTTTDFTKSGERYALVFDIPGNRTFDDLARIVDDDAEYVLIGHDSWGANGGRIIGTTLGKYAAFAIRAPFGKRWGARRPPKNPHPLRLITEMVEAGTLRPIIDTTYRLDECSEAFARLQDPDVLGKVMFVP